MKKILTILAALLLLGCGSSKVKHRDKTQEKTAASTVQTNKVKTDIVQTSSSVAAEKTTEQQTDTVTTYEGEQGDELTVTETNLSTGEVKTKIYKGSGKLTQSNRSKDVQTNKTQTSESTLQDNSVSTSRKETQETKQSTSLKSDKVKKQTFNYFNLLWLLLIPLYFLTRRAVKGYFL